MRYYHFLREYGVGVTLRFPVIKVSVEDLAVGADWTPAAGDVKIDKDGAGPANTTNLPTAVASGNGAYWQIVLTAAELQAANIVITIVDAAAKAVEDAVIVIDTYGNASAQHAANLNDAINLGLSAIPATIAGEPGGLALVGTAMEAGVCQSGSTASTIKLPAGFSASDGWYNSWAVLIVKGTGKGQSRLLSTDYVGATKIASVIGDWLTVPDNTSYVIAVAM